MSFLTSWHIWNGPKGCLTHGLSPRVSSSCLRFSTSTQREDIEKYKLQTKYHFCYPDNPVRCVVSFLFPDIIVRETGGLVGFSLCWAASFTFSIPSLMALWMCIPGAFFPLLTQAAMCVFVFISVDCLTDYFCHHFWDIKVLLFNLMVANVTLCSSLRTYFFSHLSFSLFFFFLILFCWFFICMVKHCRRAKAGLVGRLALSLSLYYALPYWF